MVLLFPSPAVDIQMYTVDAPRVVQVVSNDVKVGHYDFIGVPVDAVISDGGHGCITGSVERVSSTEFRITVTGVVGYCIFEYPVCGESDFNNECTTAQLYLHVTPPPPVITYLTPGTLTYTEMEPSITIFDGTLDIAVYDDELVGIYISIINGFDSTDILEYDTSKTNLFKVQYEEGDPQMYVQGTYIYTN
jgi:hypothetical protein